MHLKKMTTPKPKYKCVYVLGGLCFTWSKSSQSWFLCCCSSMLLVSQSACFIKFQFLIIMIGKSFGSYKDDKKSRASYQSEGVHRGFTETFRNIHEKFISLIYRSEYADLSLKQFLIMWWLIQSKLIGHLN